MHQFSTDPLKTKVELAKDAKPHPQLNLTHPSTMATTTCPKEETEGRACFQTSHADIETAKDKIYEEENEI
ncbi:hypothetical protein Bca4012_058117 [Brassica carinata]